MRGDGGDERRDRLIAGAALAVALLVLAGCQAPVDGPDRANVTVLNDSLSVDPGVVFGRVEYLIGVDGTPPETVRAYETLADYREALGVGNESGDGGSVPAFWRHVGLDETSPPANSTITFNGVASNRGRVTVVPGANASDGLVHLLTAHELTHYLHFQLGWRETLVGQLGLTTDDAFVARAVTEGSAVVTTDAYMRRWVAGDRLNSPLYDRLLSEAPPGHRARYGHAQYVHGYQYVADRVERVSGIRQVYDRPPTTGEQVLHQLPPGTEPPTPLTVEIETGEDWRAVTSDRMGEVFLRYALENGLDPDRAAAAAAGWGNDSLHTIRPLDGGNRTYAWVLRWDDAANASQFADAARDYLDARGESIDGVETWRVPTGAATLHRVDDRTTLLAFGDRAGLEMLDVGAEGSTVTMTVGDAAS